MARKPILDVQDLHQRPKGYWLRRVKTDPERISKAAHRRSVQAVANLERGS